MRVTLLSFVLALSAGACQTSPRQPAPKDRVTPSAPKAQVQTVEVRHVVAAPAQTPNPKPAGPAVAAVGRPAPDFTLPAYHRGKFTQVKLSSFRGKWVLLCFYPGDFTFV